MRKIILPLIVILLSACTLGGAMTPKQKVSEFLDKYKNQDQTILSQLDATINNEYTNSDYKSRYRTLMTNQYKNMEYVIKDEVIEDNNAVVEVEITVYDYSTAIRNSNSYLNSNPNEFMISNPTIDMENANDETTKDNNSTTQNNNTNTNNNIENNYDKDKFINYKLTQMENVTDTVKYTIEFTLTKVDNEWKMDSLSNADIEKIHGIYAS